MDGKLQEQKLLGCDGCRAIRLDHVNRRILEILQEDARTTTAVIARDVNRAESTVRERMISMERIGLIRGYHAVLDPEILGYEAHAVVRASCHLGDLDKIVEELYSIPQVVRAVLTTGKYPLVIEIVAESIRQLNWILESDLSKMDFIDIDPVVVLRDLINSRHMPITTSAVRELPRGRVVSGEVELDPPADGTPS